MSDQWVISPTLPETNSSHLKMDGWSTIVSSWGPPYFQVRTVSFQESNLQIVVYIGVNKPLCGTVYWGEQKLTTDPKFWSWLPTNGNIQVDVTIILRHRHFCDQRLEPSILFDREGAGWTLAISLIALRCLENMCLPQMVVSFWVFLYAMVGSKTSPIQQIQDFCSQWAGRKYFISNM